MDDGVAYGDCARYVSRPWLPGHRVQPEDPERRGSDRRDQARAFGHAAVRLDTNAALTEAISMYERAGYRAIDRYNDNPWATNFFEKAL